MHVSLMVEGEMCVLLISIFDQIPSPLLHIISVPEASSRRWGRSQRQRPPIPDMRPRDLDASLTKISQTRKLVALIIYACMLIIIVTNQSYSLCFMCIIFPSLIA